MLNKTADAYSFLWNKSVEPVEKWHFNAMQEVVKEPIIRGQMGIEIGSGCGYDTYIMAKANPGVHIVSIDLSDGIYETQKRVSSLANVSLVKCSALSVPMKDGIFDFAYSFGVLHHTSDPKAGLREIARMLKKNSPVFLYLYEDHSENPVKYVSIKMIRGLRLMTVRLPRGVLYFLACLMSPVVFVTFTLPARIMMKFKSTRRMAENMPFNFGRGPFSLRGDLYDRFGAPIEYRFSRDGVLEMLRDCGFSKERITRLRNTAGWVAWGYKV